MIRFGGIDIIKHVFAIAVVFIHTRTGSYSAETLAFCDAVISWIDGAVIGFFLVSGFFYPTRRMPREFSGLCAFGVSRSKRLLVPFFLFSVLYAVAMVALQKATIEDGVWATITFHGASMQLYFLPLLFAAEIIAAIWFICMAGFRYVWVGNGAALIMLVVCAFAFRTEYSTGSDPRLYSIYMLSFCTGIGLRAFGERSWMWFNVLAMISACALIDIRFIDMLIVSILLWAAISASRKFEILQQPFPGSGGVYLLHTTILNFIIAAILAKIGVSQVPNLLCTVMITYLFSLGFTISFISFFPKLRYILLE